MSDWFGSHYSENVTIYTQTWSKTRYRLTRQCRAQTERWAFSYRLKTTTLLLFESSKKAWNTQQLPPSTSLEKTNDMATAAEDKNHTKYLWTDEETATFPGLINWYTNQPNATRCQELSASLPPIFPANLQGPTLNVRRAEADGKTRLLPTLRKMSKAKTKKGKRRAVKACFLIVGPWEGSRHLSSFLVDIVFTLS